MVLTQVTMSGATPYKFNKLLSRFNFDWILLLYLNSVVTKTLRYIGEVNHKLSLMSHYPHDPMTSLHVILMVMA